MKAPENRPFAADPSGGLIGAVDVVIRAVAVDIVSSLLVMVLFACSMCSEQHCTCNIFRWWSTEADFVRIQTLHFFMAAELRYRQTFQTVESLIKRQSCQLVFDCLQDNVCTRFKGYFTKIEHNINTRNNGCSLKRLKAKLEFGRRSFAFRGALVYNTLPRHLRNLNSRFLFKSNLKEFFQ